MPPAAIESRVVVIICSVCAEPFRTYDRQRNSSVIDGGNFGALPNPP
jgi:hypothetical protein